MICSAPDRRPHACVPTFWSTQFGVNIKSVGVPPLAADIIVTQGSPEQASFAAAYGDSEGRIVAAVTFNHGRWLSHYRHLIERAAPLPGAFDDGLPGKPEPARFPHPRPLLPRSHRDGDRALAGRNGRDPVPAERTTP